jgi:hypothetical protein
MFFSSLADGHAGIPRPRLSFLFNAVALNAGSIYGDLVIAQAKSTP